MSYEEQHKKNHREGRHRSYTAVGVGEAHRSFSCVTKNELKNEPDSPVPGAVSTLHSLFWRVG
jgi:hypothetical protein